MEVLQQTSPARWSYGKDAASCLFENISHVYVCFTYNKGPKWNSNPELFAGSVLSLILDSPWVEVPWPRSYIAPNLSSFQLQTVI